MHGHMNVKKRVSFGCNVTEVSVMTTKPNFRKEMDLLTLDALDKMGMYTLVWRFTCRKLPIVLLLIAANNIWLKLYLLKTSHLRIPWYSLITCLYAKYLKQ